MPQATGVVAGKPVSSAMAGSKVPITDAAGLTGGKSLRQPKASTMLEKSPLSGAQRSVWQPSEVTSLANSPVRRQAQYCG